MRIVRTRGGFRLVQDGLVLSEVRSDPGPTNSFFDVLAACVATLTPGPRVAMLGFAAGGVVAPLRAMGFDAPIDAVDLDAEAAALFRHVSDTWAGEVRVAKADAVEWLKRGGPPYDLVLEDLSTPTDAGVTKPRASWEKLPSAIARRLSPSGVAVVNLLSVPGVPWDDLVARVREPWRKARIVTIDEYENRVVLAGRALDDANTVSRRLRRALRDIGSDQSDAVRVATL